MSSTSRIEALSPLLELLVETGDPSLRDRLFLEATLGTGASRAAALWRELRDARGTRWMRVLARGPEDRLPSALQFEALVDRRVAEDLFGDLRVFTFGARGNRVALALGATSPVEDALDAAEALLAAYAIVAGSVDVLEAFAAPMPRDPGLARLDLPEPSPTEDASSTEEGARLRHDLRNALTSILSTRELLVRFSEGLSSSEAAHFEAVIERECGRVGDILGRTARGSGECRRSVPRSPAAFVVRDVVDAERAASAQSSIEIAVHVAPQAERCTCLLDDSDLARVVRNLIVNAREALANGGGARIQVGLDCRNSPAGSSIALVVLDDGPGLPALQLEALFDAGVSLNGAPDRGQGLAIVRDLARRAGGSARACNRPEGGARFDVILGVEPAPPAPRGS